VSRITGEDRFLLKVHAVAIEDLEATLDRFLLCRQTVSSIVVSSPLPPWPLPVPEAVAGSYRAAQWMVKLSSV
jgi:Lrp/AsnC family transcriptional regulator, leucine-responsive regulatory protein